MSECCIASWSPTYYDDAGRLRDSMGRFASLAPSEVCPNGCERYGDWWVPADCPTHLGGGRDA
jgi:hypothetical protein